MPVVRAFKKNVFSAVPARRTFATAKRVHGIFDRPAESPSARPTREPARPKRTFNVRNRLASSRHHSVPVSGDVLRSNDLCHDFSTRTLIVENITHSLSRNLISSLY